MIEISKRSRRLLRIAGMSALLLSAVPGFLGITGNPWLGGQISPLSTGRFLIWLGSGLIFTVSFWVTSAGMSRERPAYVGGILLGVQTIAALTMFNMICTGLETTLLAVVAAQLGLFFPLSVGVVWLVSQTLLLAWLGIHHWGLGISIGWTSLALPFETLAMFASYYAASEAQTSQELARANAELRATQELLADSSRMAERSRISQELHDLLGHHLTAMSLNLEAARHLVQGQAREQVEKCQSLTRLLLGDVRETVRSLHGRDSVDLQRVLSPLVENIPHPRVHLSLPEDFEVSDPDRAHALIRCVQEVITNAVKHARGDNLWIELVKTEQGLEVRARDDGQGAAPVRVGQGLKGMRERLESLGGTLELHSAPGSGFEVHASMPFPEDGR